MVRWIRVLALGMLVLSLNACGRDKAGAGVAEQQVLDGFKLTVLDDSLMLDATVDSFDYAVRQHGEGVEVGIRTENARNLHAIYFDLSYDPERFNPVAGLATDALGPAGEILQICVNKERGIVHYGAILTQPQSRPGFSGTGVLVKVEFKREAAAPARTSSSVPLDSNSAPQLVYSELDASLIWSYYHTGDYNQDGQVLATDLGPIGLHFLENVYDENSAIALIDDGSHDGRILATDLGPIGLYFQSRVEHYQVCSCAEDNYAAAYPVDPQTFAGSLYLNHLGNVNLFESDGDAGQSRRRFFFPLSISPNTYYWVMPSDGVRTGIPSNAVHVGDGGVVENQPPVAAYSALPTLGYAPLNVAFDGTASSDSDGGIAKYEWDFDADDGTDTWVSSASSPSIGHLFPDAGSYYVKLRVTDSEGAQNTISGPSPILALGADGPTAVLRASVTSGDAPLLVFFDGQLSSVDNPAEARFDYDFDGDGFWDVNDAPFNLQTSHSYTDPGNYYPAMRIKDAEGDSDVDSIVLTVGGQSGPPVIDWVSPTSGVSAESVQFTAGVSGSSPSSYSWQFGSGASPNTSTLASPTVILAAPGSYNARLIVNEGQASQSTFPFTLFVAATAGPDWVNASDGTYTDKVRITWAAVAGALDYKLYRETSAGASFFSPIKTGIAGTSYDDTTAAPGTSYYYKVKARLAAGDSAHSSHDIGSRAGGSGYSETEDNDTLTSANALSLPAAAVTGNVGDDPSGYDGDDKDYFKFSVSDGARILATLNGYDQETGNIAMRLLDSAGDTFYWDDSGTPAERQFYWGLTAGTYYIDVYPKLPGDYSDYVLSIGLDYPGYDEGEPNNTLTSATSLGSSAQAFLGHVGPFGYAGPSDNCSSDYFKFTASEGQTMDFELYDYDNETGNLVVALLDNSGTLLDYEDSGQPPSRSFSWGFRAGTYYLRIQPKLVNAYSDYRLDFSLNSSSWDESEPNDTTTSADQLNLPVNSFHGHVGPYGYDGSIYDLLEFSGGLGDTLHVSLSGYDNGTGNLIAVILDGNGNAIHYEDSGQPPSRDFDYVLPEAGTHFLRIEPKLVNAYSPYYLDAQLN